MAKNRRLDSSGWKTTVVALGDIEHVASIRRLPLRPGDNDTRYRVRLVTRKIHGGPTLTDVFRDLDVIRAYNVYEQNVARLSSLAAA